MTMLSLPPAIAVYAEYCAVTENKGAHVLANFIFCNCAVNQFLMHAAKCYAHVMKTA